MTKANYLAAAIGLVAVGGLVAANVRGSGDDTGASSSETVLAEPGQTSSTATTVPDGEDTLVEAPPFLGPAGDLVDLDGWLQTDKTEFSDFDGTVRVVQFWTFSCVNCKNTLDNLRSLYEAYEPRGLEVIGVHAPEFSFEEDPAAVAEAAVDQSVIWPIALDTNKTNFRTWQPGRRFWPRTFVLDRDGNIRFDRIGEGAYDELNATVAFLIEHEDA